MDADDEYQVLEGRLKRLKFRLHPVSETETPIPPAIKSKGPRAVRYVKALFQLIKAGSKDAELALRVLRAENPVNRRPRGRRSAASTPVDLNYGTRWRLDDGGMIALELLLRVWRLRHAPKICLFFGDEASKLQEFTKETSGQWWRLAFDIFLTFYRKPEEYPELRALVGTPRRLKSGDSWRHGIIRVIRCRFRAFARKS